MDLSVIVPFHRNLEQLGRCLTAIRTAADALPPAFRVVDFIVAADGAVDDPSPVAAAAAATVLRIQGPRGPAVARSRAAEMASGQLLIFVDTDVVVHPDALARLSAHFLDRPEVGAAFGAYDEDPADAGFMSQARNLGHSFVHQRSNREASTFWAGLGAVRASVFTEVSGFDERFGRPSVEDIDLGYRIRAAGYRIVLDSTAQGKHLKRWTIRSSYISDIRDRGVPWTQLLRRYDGMQNDLNLSVNYRLCVVVSYLLALSLLGSILQPELLPVVPVAMIVVGLLDWPYYRFFTRRKGVGFTLLWLPLHIVHHLCNGVSYAIGNLLYVLQRLGIALPGALPTTAWPQVPRPAVKTVMSRQGLPL